MSRGRIPKSRRASYPSRMEVPRIEDPPRERCTCGRLHEPVQIDVLPDLTIRSLGCPVCSFEPKNLEGLREMALAVRHDAARRALR